jgi:pimeloyl-ACP methyl ester carboxylesterase
MGGIVAQELALAHPSLVGSLTLISTCAKLDERGRSIIELWGELPRLTDPRTMVQLLAPWMYTNRFFAIPGALDKLIDETLAMKYPPTLDGIFQQSRAAGLANTTARLGQIRCPTLIVSGREDILLPVEYSQTLVDSIPGSEIMVLEQTGHGLLIETPQQFVDAFHYFLTRRGFLFGTESKHGP